MSTSTEETSLALAIEVRGEVVSSNFLAFAEIVRTRLSEINRSLVTDEDFEQADQDAKAIGSAEQALKAAKERALADAEQLHVLFGQIDDLSGDLAKARLDLAKQIAARKEERKKELIEEALATFDIEPTVARRHFLSGLETAIKGKRSLESMKQALRVYATTSQAVINKSREIIERFEKAHGKELIMDRRELELRKPEEVEIELRRRWDLKKAEEEKQRLAEEAAKSKAEADKAKQDLANVGKPPAPPSRSEAAAVADSPFIPTSKPVISEREEWEQIKEGIIKAFSSLKGLQGTLRYSKNEAKLQGLRNAINAAWKEWA